MELGALVSQRHRLTNRACCQCMRTWRHARWLGGHHTPSITTTPHALPSAPLSSPPWSKVAKRPSPSRSHPVLLCSSHRATALSSSPLAELPRCAVPLPRRCATRRSNWTEHLFLELPEPSSTSQAGPRQEPRPFHATRLPPQRCPIDGSSPPAIPWLTNTSRNVACMPRTSTTLKSSLMTSGPSCRRRPPVVVFPHHCWATVVSPLPPYRHPRVSLGLEFLLGTTFSGESPPAGRNRPVKHRFASGGKAPLFWPWTKTTKWIEPLSQARRAPLWAKPTTTVSICIFLSNYSNSILINVQASVIVGNWIDLIKL
jgi:hypothetical protein